MDALETMKTRRSIRKFLPTPVPAEKLDRILEAGLYAASGMGRQPVIFLAVTDPAVRNTLSEMNRKIGGWEEGFDPFYGAPAVIVVLASKACGTYLYDGSLAMGNLMLAAHAEGLGSCWIHRAQEEFASPEGKALLEKLGISGDYEGIGHCILGYTDGAEPEAAPRKDGRVFRL